MVSKKNLIGTQKERPNDVMFQCIQTKGLQQLLSYMDASDVAGSGIVLSLQRGSVDTSLAQQVQEAVVAENLLQSMIYFKQYAYSIYMILQTLRDRFIKKSERQTRFPSILLWSGT